MIIDMFYVAVGIGIITLIAAIVLDSLVLAAASFLAWMTAFAGSMYIEYPYQIGTTDNILLEGVHSGYAGMLFFALALISVYLVYYYATDKDRKRP